MSVILLTLPLLLAQVNPASPASSPASQPPAATQAAGRAAGPAVDPATIPPPITRPGEGAALAQLPPPPKVHPVVMNTMVWLYFLGDPLVGSQENLLGGALTWIKAVSLICLAAWLFGWMLVGVKERVVARGQWVDYLGIAALVLTPASVLFRVMESMQRIGSHSIGGVPLVTAMWMAAMLLFAIWIEHALWRTIRRRGNRYDMAVLVVGHLMLAAGLAVGLWMLYEGFLLFILAYNNQFIPANLRLSWIDGLAYGVRLGLTFMSYVVFVRIAGQFGLEALRGRFRRLFAIARLSVYEANRRMWAPWVVLTVFLLVLAFTHWFLQPPRAAEMGRLYVSALTLLCSFLLTAMVTILAPLSLPTDIQQQTIYTVVSKPVRRLELVWGRMIGYMALVTMLLVVFGGVSLAYLWRTVGGTQKATKAAYEKALKEGRLTEAKQLLEQSEQLYTRMTAREPIKGSLSFLDARGQPHAMGIDVGQDVSTREPRSHIEGATPSAAIWSFGHVPDPFTPPGRRPRILNRVISVDQFLPVGTIEWDLDQIYALDNKIREAQQAKAPQDVTAWRSNQLDQAIARNQAELDRLRSDYDAKRQKADDLQDQLETAQAAGQSDEVKRIRGELDRLHAPPIKVEMSFNVYRTTKGKIGEPVYAEISASNPYTRAQIEGDIFPVREYYTNDVYLPASILAGSRGALRVEIRCLSPTQYLGMAESDLFLLPRSGRFEINYMKGLFGIWLQAMVLTAIGVFAGTFLSWPVALLTTIFFFIAGQLAFGFLVDFTRQAVMGGGPFESLIRLLTHDNQMSELAPTAGVILAKTLDSLVMPVMSMLIFVVPNFNVLDVTNMVADGFAVSWGLLGVNTLLALGYAIPFSVAGYYILKKREVAA
ncbi:MAG: hypothetical protein ACYC61_23035 [Isosphaeraceae bacterium]